MFFFNEQPETRFEGDDNQNNRIIQKKYHLNFMKHFLVALRLMMKLDL